MNPRTGSDELRSDTLTYWSGHRKHAEVENLELLHQLRLGRGELCGAGDA